MDTAIRTLADHHILLPADRRDRLVEFVELFQAYNAHTNLSAIRTAEAIWLKHIVDSLLLLKFEDLAEQRAIDLGTGGGLPGIPLAIAQPSLHMTLLDSVGKKVTACRSFIGQLELTNATAMLDRAEQLAEADQHRRHYDVVLSRATAYLPILLAWSERLMAPTGRIILYKTPSEQERQDGQAVTKELELKLVREHQYQLDGQARSLLVYERTALGRQKRQGALQ